MKVLSLLFALLSFALGTDYGRACIVLGMDASGRQYVVSIGGPPPAPPIITGEQAVIIWDGAHKTEHFIRQADISTKEANVGFVVPTPNVPQLVEADAAIFELAADQAEPKRVPAVLSQTPFEFLKRLSLSFGVTRVFTTITMQLATASAGPYVEVISEQDVANYHATVLAADDSASLSQWLKENGYAWNKDDDAWLAPYLAAKWKITAFKLLPGSGDPGTGKIQSKAIRMSFTTDRPFFPYSEPKNPPQPGGRELKVAILSDTRVSGRLDDGHTWPGELQYSGPMDMTHSAIEFLALAKLDKPTEVISPPINLTYFADYSNPRPGTADLYFSAATDEAFFQKTIIDPSLPPEYQIDWTSPLSEIQLLLMIALPALLIFTLARKLRKLEQSI